VTAETIKVREERPEDILEIRALNLAAFGRSEEGALVEALGANGGVLLSLVAMLAKRIVGHAL
jgi:predicted N-acetyltransferase YhbS